MSFDFASIFKSLLPTIISLIPVILIILIIVLVFLSWKAKIRIKFRTFKGKSFRPVRGNFGLYVYCGKQGKGKTYSLIEYLLDNKNSIQVFCNIGNIKGLDYVHFVGFKELIDIKHKLDNNELNIDENKQLVIVYDEIFTELQKKSNLNKEILDFLCQMRKRKIIFFTTCQEWAELPLSYRRFCRYEIDCNMIPFMWFGILIKQFKDAENMKWSNDDQEFIAPLQETTITKCRRKIADSYDTFLRISSVVDYSSVVSSIKTHDHEKDTEEVRSEIETL